MGSVTIIGILVISSVRWLILPVPVIWPRYFLLKRMHQLSQGSERSCACVLEVLILPLFILFSIRFLTYFKGVICFVFHFISLIVDFQNLSVVRDGPFNFQGGGLCFFFLEKYSDSQCCWKNILILVGEKNNLIQSFCHIT